MSDKPAPLTPHHLLFGRAVPGAVRQAEGWRLSWQGCAVMGILNVTPDSFSDGGKYQSVEAAVAQAHAMQKAGVLMVDIGGESTRPGAQPVAVEEEIDRVRPVVAALRDAGLVLSIDTMKPEVAAAALQAGAHLINDVSGLRDPEMRDVCTQFGAAACVMHMRGEPGTMQQNPQYGDVVSEVSDYLRQQTQQALADGVPSVLIDAGIGFGKTVEHNLALLRATRELAQQGPVLVGASRKRMIETLLGPIPPEERDPASLALHLYAARQGAAMVRVHAAAAQVQALNMQAILEVL